MSGWTVIIINFIYQRCAAMSATTFNLLQSHDKAKIKG